MASVFAAHICETCVKLPMESSGIVLFFSVSWIGRNFLVLSDELPHLSFPCCLRFCRFFINAVAECESSIKVQFSANKVEGQQKCQPFLRQAMLRQTANCELFTVGRRV